MRHFQNKFPDLTTNTTHAIEKTKWKKVLTETAQLILSKWQATFDNCDGGLYVGCSGAAYAFYYASKCSFLSDSSPQLIQNASNYIDIALGYTQRKHNRDEPASFLLGKAGVYAVASLIGKVTGNGQTAEMCNKRYAEVASVCQPVSFLRCGSDEFFVGRAGYLYGALMLNRTYGQQVVSLEVLHTLCHAMVTSGRTYAQRHRSPAPLMYAYYDTEYLGAAHGLAAILQMLLSVPDFLHSDPSIEQDVRTTVDFMMQIRQPNGNIVPAMDELHGSPRPASEELVHWCHGAPGVVYLFAKAYLTWKDTKYLDACKLCADLTWEKGLLRKGPGICHGIAGSGYVFLLLYRLTQDSKYLYRAEKFAEFMQTPEFQQKAQKPDSPYSLYEGLSGTMCFYVDLLQPEKAHFPLFDVF